MPDIQAAKAAIPLPSAELNLGGTSTSEAQFLTASAQNGVAAATRLICYTPGSNQLKYRRFVVRVGGRVTGGTTTNFTAKLYWGTSSTIASNTNIATSSTNAVNSASGNWELQASCVWDATSGKIQGVFQGWVNGTAVAAAILSNIPSSVDLSGESTSNGFTVTGTFSSGNASNAAYVDYFEVLPM
jgi:hypothetical protein